MPTVIELDIYISHYDAVKNVVPASCSKKYVRGSVVLDNVDWYAPYHDRLQIKFSNGEAYTKCTFAEFNRHFYVANRKPSED